MSGIKFSVNGIPRPKQSFRYSKAGSYTDPKVKAWQDSVSWAAKEAMAGWEMMDGYLQATITFYVPDHRRRDTDNMSKCVLDAMNKIVYNDDTQVIDLHLHKRIDKDAPRIVVSVTQAKEDIYDQI